MSYDDHHREDHVEEEEEDPRDERRYPEVGLLVDVEVGFSTEALSSVLKVLNHV